MNWDLELLSGLGCAIEEKVIVWVQILMRNKRVILLLPQGKEKKQKKPLKVARVCFARKAL